MCDYYIQLSIKCLTKLKHPSYVFPVQFTTPPEVRRRHVEVYNWFPLPPEVDLISGPVAAIARGLVKIAGTTSLLGGYYLEFMHDCGMKWLSRDMRIPMMTVMWEWAQLLNASRQKKMCRKQRHERTRRRTSLMSKGGGGSMAPSLVASLQATSTLSALKRVRVHLPIAKYNCSIISLCVWSLYRLSIDFTCASIHRAMFSQHNHPPCPMLHAPFPIPHVPYFVLCYHNLDMGRDTIDVITPPYPLSISLWLLAQLLQISYTVNLEIFVVSPSYENYMHENLTLMYTVRGHRLQKLFTKQTCTRWQLQRGTGLFLWRFQHKNLLYRCFIAWKIMVHTTVVVSHFVHSINFMFLLLQMYM